jgi:hypothetical protein
MASSLVLGSPLHQRRDTHAEGHQERNVIDRVALRNRVEYPLMFGSEPGTPDRRWVGDPSKPGVC